MALLSALLHFYIGARLAPDLPFGPLSHWVLFAWLVFSALIIPVGVGARMVERERLSDLLGWLGLVPMGFFSSLFVLTVLRDLVLLVLWVGHGLHVWPIDGDSIAADSALVVVLAAFLATLVGFFNARRTAHVVHVRVPLKDLPEALNGFRIVQISDIHVGPTIKRDYLAAIVERVNTLKPDVIAVTGDLVDGSVAKLSEHTAPLSRLTARYGSYFVTGNHEYYSGAAAWIAEVTRLGLRVLQNEHVVLSHNGAALILAGVNDFSAPKPKNSADPASLALEGAPKGPRVLLAHQPRSAAGASRAGFDLQLSGHTHGGQFLPWNLLVPLQQPFVSGLHKLGSLWVYVSRGTGYWGPPKRFGAPSEITLLTLESAPAGAT
jgi:predicted MPP superfamily phosphohydrolase